MNNREEEANQLGDLVLCKASEADLDYITRIAQAALPEHYRFPYRKEYPEDNWKWTRSEYEKYLNQPNKYAVLVVTASVKKEVGSTVKPRPIAYAVWDIDVGTKSPAGGQCSYFSLPVCSVKLTLGHFFLSPQFLASASEKMGILGT